ncbi:type II toxin-antitoxin system HicA family toxin [Capnocytophaga stomatis]|uniref:type II toxin-antitoxin system HicA family toxin n=1 Tax=Capnocytophaga TaxID=1016 RepID=UPI0028E576A8|nr:type II toxin-antitoxin system HicA family toxin [Capnocytophaga canimorsus]MDT9499142.1 type II toxin-antitoxin system HicA family toxin [Capnocytophaga canimorsus]
MKYNEFLRKIQKEGWWLLRQGKGSHEIWTNGVLEVSIPNHGSKEMPKGLEKALKKQMGL